jgi:hypothetical protein
MGASVSSFLDVQWITHIVKRRTKSSGPWGQLTKWVDVMEMRFHSSATTEGTESVAAKSRLDTMPQGNVCGLALPSLGLPHCDD